MQHARCWASRRQARRMRPKSKEVKPFYRSKAWQKLRERILKRDRYMCQESLRFGKMVPAQTVHHIFPLEDYPEYAKEKWNLVSLSWSEHNQMHDRITGRLTAKGMALMQRTATEHNININATDTDNMTRRLLIIGLPGAGKTTYARNQMKDSTLVYDLDHIAAAFRIHEGQVHEIRHGKARRMANDLLAGFAMNAARYTDDIIVIRTAPTLEEIEKINPTEVILIDAGAAAGRDMDEADIKTKRERITVVKNFCTDRKIIFKKIFRENFHA